MTELPVVPDAGAPLPGPFGVTVRVREEHTHGVLSVMEETLPAIATCRSGSPYRAAPGLEAAQK
ncbi:MAG: hypothetical protein ACRDZR_07505 [Acidimicrobiales bacterium]